MNNENFENYSATDYEELSYGKFVYKKIQKLRRKGKSRGIEVPYLGYELTKPEKLRIAFRVVAFVSLILFIAVIVAIGILYNELIKTFSDLSGIGDLLKVVFDPAVFSASFGLSAIPGIMLAMVYLLMIVLCALPIIAIFYFYRFVRDAFYMAKCSKEEFAKGTVISSRMVSLAVMIATVTVIFIIALSYVSAGNATLYLWLIFVGVIIALGGLFALMAVEKVKCGKWFEGLEESKRQNYLAHVNGLKRIKRRLNTEKQMWDNI